MNILSGICWAIAAVCWMLCGMINIKEGNYGLAIVNTFTCVFSALLSIMNFIGG